MNHSLTVKRINFDVHKKKLRVPLQCTRAHTKYSNHRQSSTQGLYKQSFDISEFD